MKLQNWENSSEAVKIAAAAMYLPDHNVEIGGRQRQQQFVGALPPLVRPDTHRDRRNEDQHDVGQELVQLIQVGQVGVEELVRPKRGERRQQHEQAQEHVARRVAEIADEVPLQHGQGGPLLEAQRRDDDRQDDQEDRVEQSRG